MSGKISKGFILKARKIEDSEVAHSSPCTREVWDLILRKANFKDKRCGNTTIKRGQWLTTYEDIRELLHWRVGYRKLTYSRHQINAVMKYLRNHLMATTRKATRGLFITIVNYDTYQTPENYERHSESHNENPSNATGQRRMKNNDLRPDSVEFGLAKLLFDLIRERKPDYKEPNLQTWAGVIDLMIRRDHRKPERIEQVIRWCQQDTTPRGPDNFCWAKNILSTERLRKQFDQLEEKMPGGVGAAAIPTLAPVARDADGLTPREKALRAI